MKCNNSKGLRGLWWLLRGKTWGRFWPNSVARHLGGFGAGEWGQGALQLQRFGG